MKTYAQDGVLVIEIILIALKDDRAIAFTPNGLGWFELKDGVFQLTRELKGIGGKSWKIVFEMEADMDINWKENWETFPGRLRRVSNHDTRLATYAAVKKLVTESDY